MKILGAALILFIILVTPAHALSLSGIISSVPGDIIKSNLPAASGNVTKNEDKQTESLSLLIAGALAKDLFDQTVSSGRVDLGKAGIALLGTYICYKF